ncbi:MAG: nicotinamide-nucleotide amidohydrolase family protein, partial [Acidobacteriota bacterium]|nr:nicotinamide-nucleotide amidohydrolase family protein [Acidobacteriota bacterium]
ALRVKYLARPGDVELIVGARAAEQGEANDRLAETVAAIRHQLGDFVYGEGDTSLVGLLCDLLADREWTLSTAESCTGGLVGTTITDLSGSSAFYLGGVVAYHDREKQALLDVPAALLERCGAVSSNVARAMATGCRERLGTQAALSVTGIAGPGGGSADKPVGLVYLGFATPDDVRVFRHTFTGDRSNIRRWAATAALDEARRALSSLGPLGQEIEQEAEGA